ncbi:hypothetical protein FE782_22630 [Paenibacillus antri]|uniref:Uncharacterized protein n=1 Tax=Paenibacillus antri TaxID=2582848 RepID=A0A5R9G0G1_9BACL|nr:hypothetical protein [Paenibacillus antri]TLS49807.1 hypothetical protein FE782_22630 [Paenibacillus antri]
MMQRLPKGITGFGDIVGSGIEEIEFKQLCFHLQNSFGFRGFDVIKTIHESYYLGKFLSDNEYLFILMNRYYPFISFANSYVYGNANFVDYTDISDYISKMNYRFAKILENEADYYKVLSKLDLNRELNKELISELNPVELGVMKYWRPQLVSDVIYNNWD